MRVVAFTKCLALAACTVVAATGCTGIATTQSFSPLMFFLPGLADSRPAAAQIVTVTNSAPEAQVASYPGTARIN